MNSTGNPQRLGEHVIGIRGEWETDGRERETNLLNEPSVCLYCIYGGCRI